MVANEPFTPTNLAGLDPDDANEVLQEVAKEFAERYAEDCKDLVEGGALTFGRLKPKERLQGYMQDTLAEDLALVLDPDYLTKRRMKQAPELMAEQLINERERLTAEHTQMSQAALQVGLPAPPSPQLPPEVPPLWPGLLPGDLRPSNPFNDYFWTWFTKDFAKLIKGVEE